MGNKKHAKEQVLITGLRGFDILRTPFLNKGTAFTHEERKALGLEGLLPPGVMTLEQQVKRAYDQFVSQGSDLQKNIYLMGLQERNKVLFYKLLTENLTEMLPIVYTPIIGEAIEAYSHDYRHPDGVYLSIDDVDNMEKTFENFTRRSDEIDLIVATDGEGILGIGDWGVGGIDISLGKLIVYTAVAGIDPKRVIPVILDTGTDQERLLTDPLYIGNKHSRVRGKKYDDFIDKYVKTVTKLFPDAVLHWEDFATDNAKRILDKYKDKTRTFNDDIQGTGAIALAAVYAIAKASRMPLGEHRIVIFGAGTAGMGIAEQIRDAMVHTGLSEEEANSQFWCIDRPGLLHDNMENLSAAQKIFARPYNEVKDWRDEERGVQLEEVVRQVHPTIMIGTSGLQGAFSKDIVKEMAKHVEHPGILPLSNPTNLAEAKPEDLIQWTSGNALIATGSPFEPVEYKGITYRIGQANNAFVFPGIGLGTIVAKSKVITKKMLDHAAKGVADMVDVTKKGAPILPDIEELHAVSATVAVKVAEAAIDEGHATKINDVIQAVQDAMWRPVYPEIKPYKK